MPKLADVLKQAGVKDEVLAGLPPEVVSAADGYVAQAESTLADAQEQLRQAGLTKAEIDQYVETYGTNLDRLTTLQAEKASMQAYLNSLKEAGTIAEIPQFGTPANPAAQPAVPGSPARGANVADVDKFKGEFNGVVTQLNSFEDARDEYFLLTGKPIPEKRADLIRQASQARKPLGEFIAEKYKFNEIKQQKADAELQAKLDAARKEGETAASKKFAEERGSNPFTASGQPSNQPYVKKINHEEFVSSSGNQPRNVRLNRMLENIHKDLQQQGA